jgi:hypothetical protein
MEFSMFNYFVDISINVREVDPSQTPGRKKAGVSFSVPRFRFSGADEVAVFLHDAVHRYVPTLADAWGNIISSYGEALEAGAAHACKSQSLTAGITKALKRELDAAMAAGSRQSQDGSNGRASSAAGSSNGRSMR